MIKFLFCLEELNERCISEELKLAVHIQTFLHEEI